MFEYFNEKAIRAVMLAQEEARRGGHNVVGTEHLLLGLIGEGTATAATLLKDLGVSLHDARRAIESMTERGPGYSPVNIPFTPKAKKIFERALQEARQLEYTGRPPERVTIHPEHLLLAIVADPESVAAKILISLGVDILRLRALLLENAGGRVAAGIAKGSPEEPRRSRPGELLEEFGRDLTREARAGRLDPVIGRDAEIDRVVRILGRRTKNNPLLLGEPGVGKTAIAEGLALRIVAGDLPETLHEKRVIALDLGSLVAGTRLRGEFEERWRGIIEEARRSPNTILFIDEIHTLVGAGASGGTLDAAELLKPALARGEIQCLGATTPDEYRQHIERDAALERRFQPVRVGEPSTDETLEILRGSRRSYETFHRVKYSDAALAAAVTLSERYISDRFLPDKAIDLLDEAGSRAHLRYSLQNRTRASEFPAGSDSASLAPESLIPVVDTEEIAEIVAAWTGIPVTKLTETESESLVDLESRLHERIIGQDEAVRAVSRAIRRARAKLKDPARPIASFLFAGPTGVGKTELSKALARFLFGSEEAMIRLDMSEFGEPHTVSRLIGSPPGYIGHEEGGRLTEAVRRKPYTVLLLDEIEKAHPDVFNLLLQLLEDGRLTDSKGRTVSFKNTLIILTSNIGSKAIEKGGDGLGFEIDTALGEARYTRIRERVNDELKRYFRPEFLNRLDDTIVFRPLTREEVGEIARILVAEIAGRLAGRGIDLEVTESFISRVVEEGFDPAYGARPLRRAITRRLEDSLAEAMLSGRVREGRRAIVDVDPEGTVTVTAGERALPHLQPVS